VRVKIDDWLGCDLVRLGVILCGAGAALAATAAAFAQAPSKPSGNFGGGAVVPAPKALFGPGSAVIGMRALPDRTLQIDATLRGKCGGGEITTTTKIAADGSFSAKGTAREDPNPTTTVTTTYEIDGAFTGASAIEGTALAQINVTSDAGPKSCRSGTVKIKARRPTGEIGTPGALPGAIYYGTTTQKTTIDRGVGPRRPIVLRISADGRLLTRGLYGEQVRCSDDTRSSGVDAPRTDVRIDAKGRVNDRERFTDEGEQVLVHVDDRFTGQFGSKGARGTFSLSDRTVDRATGNVIQSCTSGTIKWTAAP